MNKDKEQELINKYEYMFVERKRSIEVQRRHSELMTEYSKAKNAKDEAKCEEIREEQSKIGSYHSIAFGFECGDGWYDLLDELMAEIVKVDKSKGVVIHQIKEKLGGLRFYINGSLRMDILGQGSYEMGDITNLEEVHKVISKYENKSYTTCEVCGKEAKLCTTGSWLKVVCKDHREVETWAGMTQHYKPCQAFSVGQDVIVEPLYAIAEVLNTEFRDAEDMWFYTLSNGDVRPQNELKRVPYSKFYDTWAVHCRNFDSTEFKIVDSSYHPASGWVYMILAAGTDGQPFAVPEEDLTVVYEINSDGHEVIKKSTTEQPK